MRRFALLLAALAGLFALATLGVTQNASHATPSAGITTTDTPWGGDDTPWGTDDTPWGGDDTPWGED